MSIHYSRPNYIRLFGGRKIISKIREKKALCIWNRQPSGSPRTTINISGEKGNVVAGCLVEDVQRRATALAGDGTDAHVRAAEGLDGSGRIADCDDVFRHPGGVFGRKGNVVPLHSPVCVLRDKVRRVAKRCRWEGVGNRGFGS